MVGGGKPKGVNLIRTISIMILLTCCGLLLGDVPSIDAAVSQSERAAFTRSIVDLRKRQHPGFKKIRRKSTRYIVVHTSEAGLKSTLNTVNGGKVVSGRRISYGGHSHYVIARSGRTYRTLDKRYRADHAGVSMWNGRKGISDVSIGIELAGYHYMEITGSQYRSLKVLIDILKRVYHLDDRGVLTHSQVAYGKPNRWNKKNHRGRKRCAKNFIRAKAGLGPTWSFDPDVKARRLTPDRELAAIFYGRQRLAARRLGTNIITPANSAWSIAGEDFDAPTTLYRLPGGKLIAGSNIGRQLGWDRIPSNTVVLLNQEKTSGLKRSRGPIKTITGGLNAWTLAGRDYKKSTTFYFFPDGHVKRGHQISDWDELPVKTRIIVGYGKPYTLSPGRSPIHVAGKRYRARDTLYYFPDNRLLSGAEVKNFKRLPRGVLVFLPVKRS